MIERLKMGRGKVPWLTAATLSWPLIVTAGAEAGLLQTVGYSSYVMVTFNPNGQAIPVGAYELRVYAAGQNFTCLMARLVLTGGLSQVLRVRAPCQAWDVRVGLLANIAIPAWAGHPPMVNAIAHGRE